jgi:hypothetical protein
LQPVTGARISFHDTKEKTMRRFLGLGCLAFALALTSVAAEAAPQRGPTKFYDSQGGFRGYAWCRRTGDGTAVDCNYYNRAQCEMTTSYAWLACIPNPFTAYGSTAQPRRGNSRRAY